MGRIGIESNGAEYPVPWTQLTAILPPAQATAGNSAGVLSIANVSRSVPSVARLNSALAKAIRIARQTFAGEVGKVRRDRDDVPIARPGDARRGA